MKMVMSIAIIAMLLAVASVATAKEAGAKAPASKGASAPHSLQNLEAMCASRHWRECHTDLSPAKYRR